MRVSSQMKSDMGLWKNSCMLYIEFLLLINCHVIIGTCWQECSYPASCCDECACGVISVEEDYVFIDTTINIPCQLRENYNTTYSSSDVYFTEERNHDIVRLNESITRVNETTSVLQHVVSADDHRNNIYCETKDQYIATTELFVEYFPQEVIHFSCIYKGLESLYCSWQHPVNYLQPQDIQVTFEWRTNTRPFRQCPNVKDLTSCDDITEGITGASVSFRVNVTNTRKDVSTSTDISLNGFLLRIKYGKPSEIENFKVAQKSKSYVELLWKSSAELFIIQYNTTDGLNIMTTSNWSVVINNLDTYTVYKFDIVGFYTDLINSTKRVGLPSDSVSVLVRTSQDVAKSPPSVTNGGFTIYSTESTNIRNITIYWKNFKEMRLNGPITKYEVEFNKTGGRIENHMIDGDDQSRYTLTNIPNNDSGYLTVKAGTVIGMSDASSSIYIPRSTERINPPDILLEIINRKYMAVTWISRTYIEVKGYTVYWCESTVGCQREINWVNVRDNITTYIIEIIDLKKNYWFGVSMETEKMSSGFTWKSCYYRRDIEPDQPQTVQVPETEQRAITVSWIRPVCDKLSPFITYYILNWCPVVNKGDNCTGDVNSTKIYTHNSIMHMSYQIRNLVEMTHAVWLKAVSSDGKESLEVAKNYVVITSLEYMSGNRIQEYQTMLTIVVPGSIACVIGLCIFAQLRCNWYGKLIKTYFGKIEFDLPVIKLPKGDNLDVLNVKNKGNHRNRSTVSEQSKNLIPGQGFHDNKDHTAVHCASKKDISVVRCAETPLNPDYTRLCEDSSVDTMNITSKTNNKECTILHIHPEFSDSVGFGESSTDDNYLLFSPTPDDNHLIQNDTRVTENTDHRTSDIGSRISESIVDTHMIKLELHDKANLFQNGGLFESTDKPNLFPDGGRFLQSIHSNEPDTVEKGRQSGEYFVSEFLSMDSFLNNVVSVNGVTMEAQADSPCIDTRISGYVPITADVANNNTGSGLGTLDT